MKVPVSEIIVGERRREDMGNIQELADSISRYGLLHPIVVDEQKRLVAGGRRLEACKLLGWQEIDVTFLPELSNEDLRIIELEENLKRKDLNEYEKSKNMVELAEIKAEQLRKQSTQFLANFAKNPKGGRTPKVDSNQKVADELGIPRKTLEDAQQHVMAVKKYPELEKVPKSLAIDFAKRLDEQPEDIKKEVLQQLREVNDEGERRLARIEYEYRIRRAITDGINKINSLTLEEEHLDIWAREMNREELIAKEKDIDRAVINLNILKRYVQNKLKGPKLVSIGGDRS